MDPLKYILQKPMPTGRLAKWKILLTEFDFVYVTRTPLNTYFPDEEVNSVEVVPENINAWKMFFDGVVNAKGVGIGAILILPVGQHYPAMARLRFFCTNNTAEYEACIMCMNMAIDLDVQELLIMGNSDLIIRQARVEWKTRDIKLIQYRQHVEDLGKQFKSVEFKYIPRFHNYLANALDTLASMLPYPGNTHIGPLEIQVREWHGYCNAIEIESGGDPWYHDIKRFLKKKVYPEQASRDQKRTIRRLASSFFLSGEILYKRTPDLNMLRCMDSREDERIMNEVHIGVCDPHMNGYVLAKNILRVGYYWMTMEKDCFSFVRTCHQCQIHIDPIHLPPSELHPMSAPWPFVTWGMDVIEPIKTKASNGHRFILVAIDYFTKWIQAVTFKFVTKKAVADFVHSNTICRFGIPKTIISDNAANLNIHLMREVYEQFKIMHRNSTPYRHKANSVVEAANKNIKKILRKMVQGSKQRHESCLLHYRDIAQSCAHQ
uniref:Integrase catalytic domain-containing protein n=1 Tax=Nicotiana tabacum TaxID=4097 RepID=A0A1S3Z050_TOBAC|nr:PREDICTED: uncharacterized protein LOC107781542 [Nicotiana tabacum]